MQSTSGSVRPKTTVHVKSPVKVRRHTSPSKVHHSKYHGTTMRPAKLKNITTSSSLPASSPAPAQQVPALLTKSKHKGGAKGKTGRSSRHRADEGSADSLVLSNSTSPSSELMMTTSRAHHIPRLSDVTAPRPGQCQPDKQEPSRSFISGDFFNCGQVKGKNKTKQFLKN